VSTVVLSLPAGAHTSRANRIKGMARAQDSCHPGCSEGAYWARRLPAGRDPPIDGHAALGASDQAVGAGNFRGI